MIPVLILAAGSSSRFPKYEEPKQFIRFSLPREQNGSQPMWFQAASSLSGSGVLHPVVRYDHYASYYGPPVHRAVPIRINSTLGQAETLYCGLSKLRGEPGTVSDILVLNCDAGFAPGILDSLVITGRSRLQTSCVTFPAGRDEEDRWSFVDSHPIFYRCAEKKVLSENALAGAYYFPNAGDLYTACETALFELPHDREVYISHVINSMVGQKLSCRIMRDDWWDWGTQEVFERYLGVNP